MKPRIVPVIVFVFLLAAVLPVPVSGEISVRPGWDLPPPASAVTATPVEIPVWEVPAGILVSVLAGSAAELFFAIKIWAAFGYRRVEKQNVLVHVTRARIVSCIRENPGIHLQGLACKTGTCMGTLRHHLGVLLRTGTVVEGRTAQKTRFYENSGTYSKTEQVLLGHLRNGTTRSILDVIQDNPDAGRNEIARMLGITGAAVTWHTQRLEEDGIILQETVGQTARYIIPGEIRMYLSRGRGITAGTGHEREPESPEPARVS